MNKLISGAVFAAALAAASSSYAADMAYKAAPAAPPPYSWTGFYAGFNAGWTSAQNSDITFNGATNNAAITPWGLFLNGEYPRTLNGSNNGFIGGFQAGYNWQTGAIVWGIEADIQYSGARNSWALGSNPSVFVPAPLSGNRDLEWFGTVRGRVGWLATPMALFYATGGFIYGQNNFDIRGRCPTCGTPYDLTFSSSGGNTGWTVGGGVEYALGGGWSAKGEYLYYQLDDLSVTFSRFTPGGSFSTVTATADNSGHIVRFGVNYKWGGDYGKAPVVARY